jgi:hypothetical protein
MCAASVEHRDIASPTPSARDLMTLTNNDAVAEREQRIGQLIPGLSRGACPRMHAARWPDRFVATAIVTPIQMTENPYSSMMYYDWNDAHALVVLPFQSNPPVLQGIISLREHVGYRQRFAGRGVCAAVLPGAVKPDWMTSASCKCRAVVERNSPLSPGTDSQILSCPIKLQGWRVMWNWYTNGRSCSWRPSRKAAASCSPIITIGCPVGRSRQRISTCPMRAKRHVLRQAPRSPIPAVRIAIRRRGDVLRASQECATLSASAFSIVCRRAIASAISTVRRAMSACRRSTMRPSIWMTPLP